MNSYVPNSIAKMLKTLTVLTVRIKEEREKDETIRNTLISLSRPSKIT